MLLYFYVMIYVIKEDIFIFAEKLKKDEYLNVHTDIINFLNI